MSEEEQGQEEQGQEEQGQEEQGQEEGIDVPYEQIDPKTLRRMIEEFVTRDWSDFGGACSELEGQVKQVLRQLEEGQVKVVFDLRTETANLVPVVPLR